MLSLNAYTSFRAFATVISCSVFILALILPGAQAADSAGAAANPFGQLIMLAVFIGLMYFLLIRPQTKRQKEHRDLISSLNTGDEVLTSGGMMGKIIEINEQFITLAIANNVEIMLQKPAITGVLPKGTLKNLQSSQ